ncbi:MAG: hypothetical protein WD359_01180 [Dehalococcoidia bacterium]
MAGTLIGVIVLAVGIVGVGCGSSAGEEFPRVVTLGEGEVFPVILNDSLVVGENRMVMSLTGESDELVADADVVLRFYDLNGDPEEKFAADARFVPIELSYIDEQAPEPEPTDAGTGGVYVANVTFERAGEWGFKALVTTADGDRLEEAPFRFNVREDSSEPVIGEAAPASVQATLDSVEAIEDIDSSFPPRPEMHDITIAEALHTGRPLVIAFATPAYCRTRTCAPVMDTVMDPLLERYGDEATFIHVEPYVLRDLRAGFVQNPVPATREWGIQSEPWVFVVGRDGRIVAKYQGPTALDEVESALRQALR